MIVERLHMQKLAGKCAAEFLNAASGSSAVPQLLLSPSSCAPPHCAASATFCGRGMEIARASKLFFPDLIESNAMLAVSEPGVGDRISLRRMRCRGVSNTRDMRRTQAYGSLKAWIE